MPEGLDPEFANLVGVLTLSTLQWRDNLGSVTPAAITWQPVEYGHSIGSLLLHMADVEAHWIETFLLGKHRPEGEAELLLSDQTQQYDAQWPPSPPQALEWFYAIQDRIRARVIAGLVGVLADQQVERNDTVTTARWVVGHVAEHDAYHGGQAVLLHEWWKKQSAQQT